MERSIFQRIALADKGFKNTNTVFNSKSNKKHPLQYKTKKSRSDWLKTAFLFSDIKNLIQL